VADLREASGQENHNIITARLGSKGEEAWGEEGNRSVPRA